MSHSCLIMSTLHDVAFAGSDVIAFFNVRDEHTAVADFTGSRGGDDHLENVGGAVVGDHNLDFDFRKQSDTVLCTAIYGLVPFLTAVTADIGDRHPGHTHLG